MCVILPTSDKTDFNPKDREKSLHTDKGALQDYNFNVCTEHGCHQFITINTTRYKTKLISTQW